MESDGSCTIPKEAQLFAKMARVMGIINRVPKSGNNTFHKYRYATADDVADTIREAMAEVNLAFIPRMGTVRQEVVEYESSTKTSKTIRTTIDFEFIFACGDTGAVISSNWTAQVDDNSDKAINKCATSAEKYFLMKTFIVSAGDEPDADADKHREEAGRKVTPAPAVLLKWYEQPGKIEMIAERAQVNGWIEHNGAAGAKELESIIDPKTWDDFADLAAAALYVKQVVEDTLMELESQKAKPDEPQADTKPAPAPDIPADDVKKLLNGDHSRPKNGNGKSAGDFKLETGGASPFAPDADAAKAAAKELAGD